MAENALKLITGLVTVTVGFQLYRDANEFYFAHDCVRCDGTGKLVCNKCRGYGYLRKGLGDVVKAFRAAAEDTSNIYLCPFCKGTGTRACTECRGAAKLWPGARAPSRTTGAQPRPPWLTRGAARACASHPERGPHVPLERGARERGGAARAGQEDGG